MAHIVVRVGRVKLTDRQPRVRMSKNRCFLSLSYHKSAWILWENACEMKRLDFSLLALLLVLLAYISITNLQVSYDDAFITYRYAYNFASGEGFVYNPRRAISWNIRSSLGPDPGSARLDCRGGTHSHSWRHSISHFARRLLPGDVLLIPA